MLARTEQPILRVSLFLALVILASSTTAVVSSGTAGLFEGGTCSLAGTGCETWAWHDQTPGRATTFADALFTGQGGLLIAGGTSNHPSVDKQAFVHAFDPASGDPVWSTVWGTTASTTGSVNDLALAPGGAWLYAAGSGGTEDPNGEPDDAEIRVLDPSTGLITAKLSHSDPGQAGADFFRALALDPPGDRIFATGGQYEIRDPFTPLAHDILTVAVDAEQMELLWARTITGELHGNDEGVDVAVSPDGSFVVVAGYRSTSTAHRAGVLAAYDAATGDPLWSTDLGEIDDGDAMVQAVHVSSDGSAVTALGTSPGTGSFDHLTVWRVDALTGERRWTYTGQDGVETDWLTMSLLPDRGSPGVFAAAEVGDGTRTQALVVALDGSGDVRWTSSYSQPDGTRARPVDLSLGPDGSTIYAGAETRDARRNWFLSTLALESGSGNVTGVAHFQDLGADGEVGAFALAPDGSLATTLGSTGSWSTQHVLAYEPANLARPFLETLIPG